MKLEEDVKICTESKVKFEEAHRNVSCTLH